MDNTQTVSILLLGDEGVGKSAFLSALARLRSQDRDGGLDAQPLASAERLRDVDQPYIFALRSRTRSLCLAFSDTASPVDWKGLQPDMIVLCFDIGHRESLMSLQTGWIKQVRTVFAHGDGLPLLVLGLKRDLRREDDPAGTLYPHEAYQLAQQLRADMYLECSAATGALLHEVFDDICRRAVRAAAADGQSEGGCVVM